MDIEEILQELTEKILAMLGCEYKKVTVETEKADSFNINIESDNPSLLIGYHGENIHAFQHVLKVLAWKKTNQQQFTILLDVDNYRKRQEENLVKLAERKIENVRSTGRPQKLPAMSPYLRRKIHLMCMEVGNEDIETISEGEGDKRRIIIKLK